MTGELKGWTRRFWTKDDALHPERWTEEDWDGLRYAFNTHKARGSRTAHTFTFRGMRWVDSYAQRLLDGREKK